MFNVGQDIFKHGFNGTTGRQAGRGRMLFVYYFLVVLFVIFALRTLALGIQGTKTQRRHGSNGEWVAQRADIVDRNGDILAKNVASWHVMIAPKWLQDREEVARVIHKLFPNEYSLSDALSKVDDAMMSGKYKYVTYHVKESEMAKIKASLVPGLELDYRVQKRVYPKRRLFSHVVGMIGGNGNGEMGLERVYNDYLNENQEPLWTSLDARIQAVFYEQLSIAMHKYQAKGAMGMLMNSRTGEMVAMVALPDFDPENRRADPIANRMFKPMRGVYEMGSIFKTFNTALAMENGINKEYYVKEPFKIYDKFGRVAEKITDIRSFKPPRPNLTIEEIMLHSCNVGSAQIALELPDGAQREFFDRINLTRRLDLEFGRTERPLLPAKWGPVERATMSFGHGIAVTPMHLLLAVNAMTNGGIYIYPTWKKRGLGVVQGERVLSEEISARLRGVMVRITEETSAKQARIAGIQIGGKTSTAEKYINGRVDRKRNLTAFAGIFPASAPQYTILVILDEPQGTKESFGWKTAAWNAVPTTGKILDSILPLLFE